MSVTYCLTSTDTHDYVIWYEMYVKRRPGHNMQNCLQDTTL